MYCNSDDPELDSRIWGDSKKYFKEAYKDSKEIILSQLEKADKKLESLDSEMDNFSKGMDEMNDWVADLLKDYKELEPENEHKENNIELLEKWTTLKE